MEIRRRLPWGIVGGALLLAMACNEVTPTPAQWSAPTPPPVTSEALRPTLEQAQVQVYLAEIEAQQTLNAVYAQKTATAEARRAWEAQRAWETTATAESIRATATVEVWRTTVEAARVYATATAEAARVYATATAQAHRATVTAEALLFAQSATATAGAWSVNATATAEALRSEATVQAAAAERARLATERERMVNEIQAYAPWAIGFLAGLLALYAGLLWIQKRKGVNVIPRDPRGDSPLIVVVGDKGTTIFDPDRSLGPGNVLVDGEIRQPQLAPAEIQDRVTARDQAVDLVHRGLPRESAQAAKLMAPPSQPALPGSRVRVIAPEQARAWLDEVTPQALQTVIEGEIVEDEE